MIRNRLLCLNISAALLLVSCVVPPPVPEDVVTGKYAASRADEVFIKVNGEYGAAQQEGLDFFAPDQFNKGRVALSKAASLRRTNAEDIKVLTQLYIAEKQLNICRQVKTQAEKQMPEVLSALQTLRAKSVSRSYPREFDALVYQSSKLMRDVEDFVLGKPVAPGKDVAKAKAKLLQELHELEIKVVKHNALNQSDVLFKEVTSIGGKRLAPKTFEKAEQAQREANAVIEEDVKNDAAIAEAAKKYEFAAFHALHVTRAVDKLASLDRSEYETYVLDLETKLQAIAEAFDYRDIRNHALHEQIQVLTGLAQRLMIQKANLVQTSGGSASDDIGLNELKERLMKSMHKNQELADQLAQLQSHQSSVTITPPDEVKQLRQKTAQLEEQVSLLTLKYNNLQAERDSLQNKLNAMVSKKGDSK